jgi:hypothetical protein
MVRPQTGQAEGNAESDKDKTQTQAGAADKDKNALKLASIGKQLDSSKPTMPSFSFGTGQRDVARNKIFISKKHEGKKATMNSPGPIYNVKSTLGPGEVPCHRFGTEVRHYVTQKYPDSSVDINCAIVDAQKLKFSETPRVMFGLESRSNAKNAEVLRAHPGAAYGTESPGALHYSPEEKLLLKNEPKYSFGPKKDFKEVKGKEAKETKIVARLQLPLTSVPRHVGPGSHAQPAGIGTQPQSARGTAPSWKFGTGGLGDRVASGKGGEEIQLDLETHDIRSSLGTQHVSSARNQPRARFGTETRDMRERTHLVRTRLDQGPSAFMEKLTFHHDLPARTPRPVLKTGM